MNPAVEAVSVFFPCFNDEATIARMVEVAVATLARVGVCEAEVIVVNDGSTDGSAAVLADLMIHEPLLRVVTHDHNRGYGGALLSGFGAAKHQWVFYTDGDGQYDPSDLPRLLDLVRADTGLVNGYKLERHDPAHRIWIGSTYNFCARLLFRIRIRDIDCDYRLIRRNLLERILLTSTSGTICVELVRKIELTGCGVAETGVHHYPRLHGTSQFFRVKSLLKTLIELVRLWVRVVVLP